MTARKVMLLGEIGVGKSSIVRRLVLDRFDTEYKPTIGVDIYRYEIPAAADREAMSLIIWDTDGNFGSTIFRHVYMKEASAALIIGDITRFGTIDLMVKLGLGFMDAFPGRYCGYVLNKSDLLGTDGAPTLPAALTNAGDRLMQTSAKTGDNVAQAFHHAASAIRRRVH